MLQIAPTIINCAASYQAPATVSLRLYIDGRGRIGVVGADPRPPTAVYQCVQSAVRRVRLRASGQEPFFANYPIRLRSTNSRPASLRHAHRPSTRRRWGLGTTLGVGGASAQATTSYGESVSLDFGLALMLPTIEATFFYSDRGSIDVWLGLVDSILNSALMGLFYLRFGFLQTNYFGSGRVRGLISVGMGFDFFGGGGIFGFSGRVPVRLGVEFISRSLGFAFRLMARPYFVVSYFNFYEGGGTAFGGGVLAELGFHFFRAR